MNISQRTGLLVVAGIIFGLSGLWLLFAFSFAEGFGGPDAASNLHYVPMFNFALGIASFIDMWESRKTTFHTWAVVGMIFYFILYFPSFLFLM